jgi:PucR family transcriptional regulator, purine catabolism regulatory protein
MRVSDLLDMDLLKDAGVEVLSGSEHLNRQIQWVHTGEIADIAQFLSGGEALLTAATGLGKEPKELRRYVRELAEAGAVCLVIELGRGFRKVPDEMVDEAARYPLVIAALQEEVPFAAVTRQAHTELISSAHSALQRAIAIDDALNALILEGASLSAVLELLAEQLCNPVVLEDGARRVVDYGRSAGSVTPLLRAWQAHSRHGHLRSDVKAVREAEGPPRCMWSTITVKGDEWGRLHVIELDSPLDDAARLALGRASASVALYLMAERDAALSNAAEHSLVGALALAEGFSGQDFLARAAGLGVDLEGELMMIVVGPSSGENGEGGGDRNVEQGSAELRRALRDARWPSVVGFVEGNLTAILAAGDEGDIESRLEKVLKELDGGPFAGSHLGISRKCSVSQLPRAQSEANAAHRLGPSSSEKRIHFYEDLVLFRLLAPLQSGPTLANFVEDELKPLIEHDERQNSELLKTLDAYLRTNGNKIATAKLLQLQRRSVYYRLERIEKVLGCSIEDPELRVRLYVALRAREMLVVDPN